MQELLRVLGNKKCIVWFWVILILSGWLNNDYYSQGYQEDVSKEYETLIKQYAGKDYTEAYKETETILSAAIPEITINEAGDVTEPEEDAYTEALRMVNAQLSHITGYSGYLDYVQENAETMKTLSVFRSEESFTNKNIEKTVYDFNQMQDVELKLDMENAISAFHDGGFSWIFLLLSPLPVLLVYIEERKNGLWQFVYATFGGRRRLAAKRCGILALYTAASVVVLEVQRMLIITKYFGDFGDLSRAVQSNAGFLECVLEINMGQYLMLTVIVKILICICVSMLVWILSLVIKNSLGVFVGTALFVFAEYQAYMGIEVRSSYEGLKYINLFSFLDSANSLTNYRNLNICGNPVGVWEILLYGLPVIFVFLCLAMVLLGARRPFMISEDILSKYMGKFMFWVKPYKHTVLVLHEGYKMHIKQFGLVVLAVLTAVCACVFKPEEVYYDYANTIYISYMEQIQGEYSVEKQEYLKQEDAAWKKKIAECTNKIEEYQRRLGLGDGSEKDIFATTKEYEREQKKVAQYMEANEVVTDLLAYSEQLSEAQKQGHNAGYVNRIGYERLTGSKGEERMTQSSLLIMVTLVAALSAVMCFETSQNAKKFIQSTRRGRRFVLLGKSIHMMIITVAVVLIVSVAQFIYTDRSYGLGGYEFSVQSIEGMAQFPMSVSVGQMLGLVVLGRIFCAWTCSMIIKCISAKSKNLLTSVLVGAVVLIIPAVAVSMGVEVMSYISLIRSLGVTHFWNNYGFENMMWILPVGVVSVAGIVMWIGEIYGQKS